MEMGRTCGHARTHTHTDRLTKRKREREKVGGRKVDKTTHTHTYRQTNRYTHRQTQKTHTYRWRGGTERKRREGGNWEINKLCSECRDGRFK